MNVTKPDDSWMTMYIVPTVTVLFLPFSFVIVMGYKKNKRRELIILYFYNAYLETGGKAMIC